MNHDTQNRRVLLALATVLLLALGVVLAACGDDDEESGAQSGTTTRQAAGNAFDRAFVAEMIPHHESAVEMAGIADDRARSTFVRELATEITRTQTEEIGTLRAIDRRLAAAGVERGDMGMDMTQMGMDSDMGALASADPFDRAFVDEMVPHHRGAVMMARMQLQRGQDPELRRLAEAIITAQEREIREMNAFREERYGGPVPESGAGMHGGHSG
jgi:uncharacterized protein (DUF305 family)